MDTLVFLTDRFPYSNGETFIENEISFLSSEFDKIIIVPFAMMLDTSTQRQVPPNVEVLEPPISEDIFLSAPSLWKKASWTFRHLAGWSLVCLFKKEFYSEVIEQIREKRITIGRIGLVFKRLAPAVRNAAYYKKRMRSLSGNIYVYSYWLDSTLLYLKRIISGKEFVRIITRTHAIDLYSERNNQNYLPFQKKIIDCVDDVYAISENGLEYLKNKYPEHSAKFHLSYLGTTDYGSNPPTSYRDSFVIVSCCHIIPLKRVNLIIDGIAEYAKQKKTNIKWVHFGKGTDFQTIQDYAKKTIPSSVEYQFYGAIGNRELMEYYGQNHIDVFVSASETEGLPVSIMEAVSFGIPIIATDVGGTREIVFSGRNGYLLNKEFSTNDFVDALDKVFSQRNNGYLRHQSRAIWEQKFRAAKNYPEFIGRIRNQD